MRSVRLKSKSRSQDAAVVASRAKKSRFFSAPGPYHGKFEPMAYQHAGVEYAIQREHCLIGDAPGLGKTAQSLLFGNSIGAEYTLIICPASLRLNWQREVKMWSALEKPTTYPILKSKDGVSLKHNYVIVSYSLLANDGIMTALTDDRWDHVILDEAHAIKDPNLNIRTARVINEEWGIKSVADRISMLSGTIMPNQPIECYNAVRLLDWDAIERMSVEDFRENYYEEGEGWIRAPVEHTTEDGQPFTTWELTYSTNVRNRPVNMDDLQYRLRKNIMVRRLKEDVLDQLPKKQWKIVPTESSAQARRVMKSRGWKEVEKLYQFDPEAFDRGVPVDGEIGTLMRQLGEAKAPMVADYIEELLAEGVHKIMVGCWHVNTVEGEGVGSTGLSVYEYLRKRLEKYGWVGMHGGHSTTAKQHAVDLFQEKEDIRIIQGQLITIGEGWTLTAAQDGVLAEFYWVPGKNDQLLDRLHRFGQQGDYVLGHIPFIPGSMDERVMGTAVWKDQNIYAAMDAEFD